MSRMGPRWLQGANLILLPSGAWHPAHTLGLCPPDVEGGDRRRSLVCGDRGPACGRLPASPWRGCPADLSPGRSSGCWRLGVAEGWRTLPPGDPQCPNRSWLLVATSDVASAQRHSQDMACGSSSAPECVSACSYVCGCVHLCVRACLRTSECSPFHVCPSGRSKVPTRLGADRQHPAP